MQLALLSDDCHDPGGKVKTALSAGMVGGAVFHGEREQYRTRLWRYWDLRAGEDPQSIPFALWCGLNPSTADSGGNDPTVSREIGFTKRMGYRRYEKCNVMDYRATSPKALLAEGVVPCSPVNLGTTMDMARRADTVVACWGKVHKRLRRHVDDLLTALRDAGVDTYCLGLCKDGVSPRHPLYVASNTDLVPYRSAA